MELQDEIWLSQGPELLEHGTAVPQQVLLYFLTGNPGLIEFYRVFLTSLSQQFKSSAESIRYHFVGYSLAGYQLHDHEDEDLLPLSLEGQIDHVEAKLSRTAIELQGQQRQACAAKEVPVRPLPVILVGHSVGTYMILQLIARRQKAQAANDMDAKADYELVGGICLFPTIIDIASSPSGKRVSLVASSTWLAPTLQAISKGLCAVCPAWVLLSLVQRITGQNAGAARTTAAFLGSKYGVVQALHMGRHELLEMAADKWSDDLWNGPSPGIESPIDRPKLYFYWGENDHWIAGTTRDSVIASRARQGNAVEEGGKPEMEVDTHGTPHDFCISEERSFLVAEKSAGYIKELVKSLILGDPV